MDNRPLWVIEVETALARGADAYREAAEIIENAMQVDPTLTQALVAEHIGMSTTWISRLRAWHRAGRASAGPDAGLSFIGWRQAAHA